MNDKCGACTKTISSRIGADTLEIQNSQIVDLSKDIHFVTEKRELATLKCISSEILSLKQVQEGLRAFVNSYQIDNTEQLYKAKSVEEVPENYEFVALSAYGSALLVPVDKKIAFFLTNPATNDDYVSRARLAASQHGKCNSASSGCTKGSKKYTFPRLRSIL